MNKRRIMIFDKKKGIIVYDKPVDCAGSYATYTIDLIVIDCMEENADYERKELTTKKNKKR